MKQRLFQTKLSRLTPAALVAAVMLTLTFSSTSSALTNPAVAPTTTVTATSSMWSFAPNGPAPTMPDTPDTPGRPATPANLTEVAPSESPPATPTLNTPKLTG